MKISMTTKDAVRLVKLLAVKIRRAQTHLMSITHLSGLDLETGTKANCSMD
jgi:hypothetical protein